MPAPPGTAIRNGAHASDLPRRRPRSSSCEDAPRASADRRQYRPQPLVKSFSVRSTTSVFSPRLVKDPIVRSRGIGWRSEEHTSELQSLMRHSYAVLSLKKKKITLSYIGIEQ